MSNKVGYKETKVGLIPEQWEVKPLKELCDLLNGRAYKKDELLSEGKTPILRVGNFFTNQQWYYSDLELEESKYCDNGDLLYAWSASFGPKIWDGSKVIYHYHIWKLRLAENIDKKFLYYSLLADVNKLKRSLTGSTMVHISKENMEPRLFPVPSLKEQQKIAEILSSVDAAIEKTEQVIAKTEEVKKGLMQQLLTKGIGHTEFKQTEIGEIPLTWDLVKLEEVTQLITKGTTPTTYGYKFEDNGVNFIKVENLRQSINSNELLKISYECHEKLQRSQLQIGDILFSIAGTLGSTYIVDESILPCNTNQALSIIRLKNNVNICYINYVLNSNLIQKEIDGLRTVGAQPNLNLKQVGNFTIPFPPIEEQDRISQVIKKNEEMVYNEIKKLKKLKSLKQGLMQQLLTGQVRVKID